MIVTALFAGTCNCSLCHIMLRVENGLVRKSASEVQICVTAGLLGIDVDESYLWPKMLKARIACCITFIDK